MNKNELIERIKAQPFRPFRIVTSDGEGHEVRHPELVRLGSDDRGRVIYLFEPVADDPVEVKIPAKTINLTHVTTLEPVEQDVGGEEAKR
jgi:hypothetical protein